MNPFEKIASLKKYWDLLKKKLQDFYNALGWGELPINIKVDRDILNMFGL